MPEVRIIQTRSLTIEPRSHHEIWADGEHVGQTPAYLEVVPNAVEMLVPRPPASSNGRADRPD
jgi:diacylglycerol kinase family enzyme